ncbi:DNA topoisomerase IV, alpha subunit [Pluteus cervinus]|uniref:DNA topoisomerase IV, alpha subunit n=1 Tax=Pluteus cervinus TaxID=181527 RepID=A0ACD3BAN9_9AGAR|nr:DNA topoisomerase IV, alpha subunit [Pluteus cervinus]
MPDSEFESDTEEVQGSATEKIEEMVLSFLTQLSLASEDSGEEDNEPSSSGIKRKFDPKKKISIELADRTKSSVMRSIAFPRKSSTGSARPLAQLFRLLDLSHEAISRGIPITKRDAYYNDVPLFKNQRVVDKLVDDLAATFEMERADLCIRATSKGLVAGAHLLMSLHSGEEVQCKDSEGTIIPSGEDIASFSISEDIFWVLLVEKDAVFQTLCYYKLSNFPSLPGPGIVITGKGYPDVATRHLVKTLSDNLPRHVPIVALVDGDPYGIDIMSVYKYGSQSLSHENDKLAAKRVKWLGLWATELESLGISEEKLIPMTKEDDKKALSMLRRESTHLPVRWREELSHMLENHRKAEIEILSNAKALGDLLSSSVEIEAQPNLTPLSPDGGIYSQSNASRSSNTTLHSTSGQTPDTPPTSSHSNRHSEAPQTTWPPLIRYLVHKLSKCVQVAQDREKETYG